MQHFFNTMLNKSTLKGSVFFYCILFNLFCTVKSDAWWLKTFTNPCSKEPFINVRLLYTPYAIMIWWIQNDYAWHIVIGQLFSRCMTNCLMNTVQTLCLNLTNCTEGCLDIQAIKLTLIYYNLNTCSKTITSVENQWMNDLSSTLLQRTSILDTVTVHRGHYRTKQNDDVNVSGVYFGL